MRFLESNEIEQLEKDLDEKELPLSAENLEQELERLQAIKDKLPSKYDLSIELMCIDEAREIDPSGIANPFKKLKVAMDAQKRYKTAQKRFSSANKLRAEVDGRISDINSLIEFRNALPEYKNYSVKTAANTDVKQAEGVQLEQ